ncbi:hypothetical protein [Nocardia abscessus]|uniref:hypothetical protein n=1 Tax=Nocardia abscessus TaxID=120957 RepID=UPI0024557554|nr:hypothetical protein [Nocardia abscessus]
MVASTAPRWLANQAALEAQAPATVVMCIGAFAFGVVIGWNLYYVNRYRVDRTGVRDIATLLAALGGAAVLTLFPAGNELFGWYSIGLASGFFFYLVIIALLVRRSRTLDVDFMLTGRIPGARKKQEPSQRPITGHALPGEEI